MWWVYTMENNLPEALADGLSWFDDWFALEDIAQGIIAIGEPRYHYRNWNYLIEGDDAALLFDTGPGLRDIAPVVASITKKPLIVVPSHLHFDHVGNLHKFSSIAMADLPLLRALDQNGVIQENADLFLGDWENLKWPHFSVSRWLAIGSEINLGGRTLEVFHTPGHSPDSITLYLKPDNILLVADFIYPGALYAQVPGSNLADYLSSADALLAHCPRSCRLFGAHGADPAPQGQRAPELKMTDIVDLQRALAKLKNEGGQPENTVINDRMSLLASKDAFAPWQSP
jgi:hydroxyacylglutathione hydrolase